MNNITAQQEDVLIAAGVAIGEKQTESAAIEHELTELLSSMHIEAAKKAAPKKSSKKPKDEDEEDDDDDDIMMISKKKMTILEVMTLMMISILTQTLTSKSLICLNLQKGNQPVKKA